MQFAHCPEPGRSRKFLTKKILYFAHMMYTVMVVLIAITTFPDMDKTAACNQTLHQQDRSFFVACSICHMLHMLLVAALLAPNEVPGFKTDLKFKQIS